MRSKMSSQPLAGCDWLAAFITIIAILSLTSPTNSQDIRVGCSGEADVVFLLDAGAATGRFKDFDNSLNFLRSLVTQLEVALGRTRVGATTFPLGTNQPIHLSEYTDSHRLSAQLDKMFEWTIETESNLTEALDRVRTEMFIADRGDRVAVPNVLVIITNDLLDANDDVTQEEAEITREDGITILMVAYGRNRNRKLIQKDINELVSKPASENSWMTGSSDSMYLYRDRVTDVLCGKIPYCAGEADILFVLDSSGSIRYSDWLRLLETVHVIVDEFYIARDGVHVAAITYSTEVQLEIKFNDYYNLQDLHDAIDSISYLEGFDTHTLLALEMAGKVFSEQEFGNRLRARDIVIFVTDGASFDQEVPYMASALHKLGVRVFAVGVGDFDADPDFLEELQSIAWDENHLFSLGDFQELTFIENTLVDRTCREGVPSCDKAVDVIFAVDASGSIPKQQFEKVLNFVRSLASNLKVDNGIARVGFLTFAEEVYINFNLNDFTTNKDVTREIITAQYRRTTTNTAEAIRVVREVMFTPEAGAREGVDHILVIITDGESNDPVETVTQARELRDEGVDILTVGIGQWIRRYELEGMASNPKTKNFFIVDTYDTLFQISNFLLATVCDVTDDCESNPCGNGGTCIDGRNMYFCQCVSGFTGRDCGEVCPNPADVVFLLDSSGSIDRPNFFIMQDFVHDVIYGIGVETTNSRVGVLQYSSNATVIFHLNEHNTTRGVLNGLNLRFTGGTTNTAAALREARINMLTPGRGDRDGILNVVILLTDGKSMNRDDTWAESLALKKAGAHIVSIGIGSTVGITELEGVTTDPDYRNMFISTDFDALGSIVDGVLESICNTVNECRKDPCENGGTCIDGIGRYTCQCEQGFTGPQCQQVCNNVADIAIVIDTSGSIQRSNFREVVSFTKELIDGMDLSSGRISVGVMYYSEEATIQVPLRTAEDVEDIMFGIDTLPYTGGQTNIADALMKLRTMMFTGQNGDRAEVPDYAIIFTDGVPNLATDRTIQEAVRAHIRGIHVVVVTVGKGLTQGRAYLHLQAIATDPVPANYFNVHKYSDLNSLLPGVSGAICNATNECDSNPCQNEGVCIDGLQKFRCDCTDRYTGVYCEKECRQLNDVVFLVDISGSLEKGFDSQVSFMRELVQGMDFRRERVRLALTTFAGEVNYIFNLTTYTQKEDILNSININKVQQETDIASALQAVRENVLIGKNGNRNGVPDNVILMSDGRATQRRNDVQMEADKLKAENVRMYVVGVGNGIDSGVLSGIASSPTSSNEFNIISREDVEDKAFDLLDELCQ